MPPPRWAVVVPVKRWAGAKTRLTDDVTRRQAQARAFALDVVAATRSAPGVAGVVVVTGEPTLDELLSPRSRPVASGSGGRTAAEDPAGVPHPAAVVVVSDEGGGLDDSVRLGAEAARRLWPGLDVAALTADLPALRPADLAAVLAAAVHHRHGVVADTEGTGTTMLTATAAALLRPSFGPGSFARHRRLGAVDLSPVAAPGVRRDVDVGAHLAAARALGLAPHTRALDAAADDVSD